MAITFRRIVAVYDLDPIVLSPASDALHFRVEIIRRSRTGRLEARIWRYEFFRLQPTFPQRKGKPIHEASDESILVEDQTFLKSPIKTPHADVEAALQYVLKRLSARLEIA